MAYAAVSDLCKRFSERQLIQLTDRATPPTDAVNHGVAQKALDAATTIINGYVSAKYKLPLTNPSELLTELCCDIARYRLFSDQVPEVVQKRYDTAMATLKGISAGSVKIDGADDGPEPASRPGTVTATGPCRRFSRDSLRSA